MDIENLAVPPANSPGLSTEGEEVGIEAARSMMRRAYARSPDLRVEVVDLIVEHDCVAVRNLWPGTQAQDHRRIDFPDSVLRQFADGEIVEGWGTFTPPKEMIQPGASSHE